MSKIRTVIKESFFDDTIAAISTPIGQSGIGIVRLSGKDALVIADKIFLPKEKIKPSQCKTYTIHYGWIAKGLARNEIIDEAILTVMRSPRTYTREDVVEVNCHGGIVPLRKIFELVLSCGARPAEPGEFTRRAFENGRIDLVQAEAVLDIIQAKTDSSLQLGLNQLQGKLSVRISEIRQELLNIFAHLEASIDFPDEDIEIRKRKGLLLQLDGADKKIKKLLSSAFQGKILREGVTVVICGKPNVGKSSLLNALLKEERAIVTHIPGTTKDTIEEFANIKGLPLKLIDTAGIDRPKDLIDEEAIKRSRLSMQNADVVIFVLDGARKISAEDRKIFSEIKGKPVICAINKIDLKPRVNSDRVKALTGNSKMVRVSALKNIGIKELEEGIAGIVWQGHLAPREEILISNLRHIGLLREAHAAVDKTRLAFRERLSGEFISHELKEALVALDKITGGVASEDLLDKIFAEFCIGK